MAELENGWVDLHELTCYVTLRPYNKLRPIA